MMNIPNMMPGFTGQPMMAGQRFPGTQIAPQQMPSPGIAQFPTQRAPWSGGQPKQQMPNSGIPQFPTQPQWTSGQPKQQMPTAGAPQFPTQPHQFAGGQPSQQSPQTVPDGGALPPPPPSFNVPPVAPNGSNEDLPRLASIKMVEPAPTIRLQSNDGPTPETRPVLTMPAPEKLGIGMSSGVPQTPAATHVALDWNQVHARLRQLGAISFQMHKSANAYRVVFVLASRGDGQPRYVETEATSEGEAVMAALHRAEALAN